MAKVNENRKGCVYMHRNLKNNKVYIGITVNYENPNNRWKSGQGYKPKQGKPPSRFYSSICKYGWDCFDHIILFVGKYSECKELEKKFIEFYRAKNRKHGYNITRGGEGNYKYKDSKTAKEHKLQRHRQYYAQNKEIIKEKDKEYRRKNKDIIKEREKKRRKTDHYRQWKQDYYDKNKDVINAKKRRNKERCEKCIYCEEFISKNKRQCLRCIKRNITGARMQDIYKCEHYTPRGEENN